MQNCHLLDVLLDSVDDTAVVADNAANQSLYLAVRNNRNRTVSIAQSEPTTLLHRLRIVVGQHSCSSTPRSTSLIVRATMVLLFDVRRLAG